MKFKTNFKLKLENKTDFESRINTYFNTYGFEIVKENENHFKLSKRAFFWIDRKFNPLDWESDILIEKTSENEILITYQSDGTRHFNPEIHQELFEAFFNNFMSFANNNKPFKEANQIAIKKAKKKLVIYAPALLIGMAIGYSVSTFLSKDFDLNLISYVSIYLSSYLSIILTSIYLDRKYFK